MPDEVTFFDLVTLMKIKPGITVERYGGLINSSFFDGAKVLGTLQQKKLVSLTTAMPDQNPITVTDTGKQLIAEADEKAKLDFDHLDLEILIQASKGKSNPDELGKIVNVRPKDLAMHLYRLTKQDYATYELVSGTVSIMLTEKGFTQSKMGMPVKPQPQPTAEQAAAAAGQASNVPQPPEMATMQQQMNMQPQDQMPPAAATAPKEETKAEQPAEHPSHTKRNAIIFLIVLIILVAVGYLYYKHYFTL